MTKYHELTEAQKRIWYIEQMYPDVPIHNIGGYVRIKGNICLNKLKTVLLSIIEAHQSLRIRIIKRGDIPYQYVTQQYSNKITTFDFSLYHQQAEALFYQWVDEEAKKVFKLHNCPLFYFACFRINENDCGYLIKLHHIIADMWSLSLLTKQIQELYEAENQKSISIQKSNYLDYLTVEKIYLKSQKYVQDRSFWLKTFQPLSLFQKTEKLYTSTSKRATFLIDEILSIKIKQLINSEQLSINIFFNVIVGLYFYLKQGIKNQIIGIPLFNRHTLIEKNTVGMFVNTLPFHIEVNPALTMRAFCKHIKKQLARHYIHHRYPYNTLVKEAGFKGIDLIASMRVSVNFYHLQHPVTFNGFQVINKDFFSGHQIYPIHIIVNEWQKDKIQFHIEYQIDSYEATEIDYTANDLISLIRIILESPEKIIGEISLPSQDPNLFQSPPYINTATLSPLANQTVIDLFEKQVQAHPHKIAVQENERALSYINLLQKVDILASFLTKQIEGKSIAIIGFPSTECLIAILAILKLGLSYIPINLHEPEYRLNQIIQDAQVKILLYWKGISSSLAHVQCRKIAVDNILTTSSCLTEPFISKALSSQLAYIIYTSGSTGNPKGVEISHHSLISYLHWATTYVQHENSVFAFYTSISFDLTVTSIFLPLITGGKIKIFQEKEQYILQSILEDKEVTILKTTPSHLTLCQDKVIQRSSLKCLIVGGEDFKVELARQIQMNIGGHVYIYNEYGPTETTVGCMLYCFNQNIDQIGSVPIGYAMGSVKLLILDENQKKVSPGKIGELYIGGDQVAQGYLNQPLLSSKSFIKFSNSVIPFYKTGDLVAQTSRGALTFKGRKDEEIKINGYRIELGEIQSVLLLFPNIKHAYLLPISGQSRVLIGAFFVSDKKIDTQQLASFLKKYLSAYKVPSFLIQINSLPLTKNGKIDKTHLLNLMNQFIKNNSAATFDDSLENAVLNTIKSVLNLETVDQNANYFHLGGDSISAIQISSKLASQGVDLTVRSIMSAKSIRDILILAVERKASKPLTVSSGVQPLTSILHWFFKQQFKRPHFYHHSVLLQLKNLIRSDQVEKCLNMLVRFHDTLRLNYDVNKDTLFYNHVLKKKMIKVKSYDLTKIDIQAVQKHVETIAIFLKSQTNLNKGHLLSAALIFQPDGKQSLLMCVHHLCMDGISWQILLDDLNKNLNSSRLRLPIQLGYPTSSFQSWVAGLKRISTQPILNDDLSRFLSLVPASLVGSAVESDKCLQIKFSLSQEITHQLLNQSEHLLDTQVVHLLTTAYIMTLGTLTSKTQLLVTLEHHGRISPNNNIDVSRTVGWFTVMLPLYFSVSQDVEKMIKETKKILSLFHRYAHQFTITNPWVEKLPTDYRFNYLGSLNTVYSEFSIDQIGLGDDSHQDNKKPLIDLNAYLMNNELSHILVISSHLPFSPDEFIQTYKKMIDLILKYSQTRKEGHFLSNFDSLDLEQEDIEEFVQP